MTRSATLLALAGALLPVIGAAQEAERWNEPQALALVARASEVRQAESVDPERRAYQALATGHVFFLVDRPTTGERSLVKADQIAVEVYWQAPRATRQRIVGLRDRKVLPTNIRYHLDHLTVVQDDFGDVIRIGDGDEVSSVVHPIAPGAEQVYDFALGDALAIAFPDGGQVEVQEIRVRPRSLDRPGFVGSVYLDRASAAIVRMKFTFTPASYVDPYLDYIQISLDNSLWEGRWWLPYRQELELRREMPQLDFLVGSVIRGRFEIGEYALNPELPDTLFTGARVTAVPEAERRAYAFRDPLVPSVESADLAPTPTLEEVRAEALRLTAGRYLSGLARLRLHVPTAAHALRWNRAEGLFLGAGATWRPTGAVQLQARAGWSFGRDRPSLGATLTAGQNRPGTGIALTLDELRDLGPFPGVPLTLNTISALSGGRDWLDPWFSSGAEVFHTLAVAGAEAKVAVGWERHESAGVTLDPDDAADFAPVAPIDEGDLASASLTIRTPPRAGAELRIRAEGFRFDPSADRGSWRGATLSGTAGYERGVRGSGPLVTASLDGGLGLGPTPRQRLFHLGGLGTLPGHPYREQIGDRFWLARADVGHPLIAPWVTLRALAAAGWAAVDGDVDASEPEWAAGGDDRVRASVGGGVGLGWDVLHLDLMRGLDGGEWELVVSVDRRFRGWL